MKSLKGIKSAYRCPSGEKTVIALSYREPILAAALSLSRCHADAPTLALRQMCTLTSPRQY